MSNYYIANQIQTLMGRDAVRLRPGMYIGDNRDKGLHQLVYELIENSLEESLNGYGTKIDLTIHSDNSITVTDYGRGLPVNLHESGICLAELFLTKLQAGEKFDSPAYGKTKKHFGVGLPCVNFLSEWLKLEIRSRGKIHTQQYQIGLPISPLESAGRSTQTGTKITFKPDPLVMHVSEFNFETILWKLQQKAFLNSRVRFLLIDEREGRKGYVKLYYPKGLISFVQFLNKGHRTIHSTPISFEKLAHAQEDYFKPTYLEIAPSKENIGINFAFQYNDSLTHQIFTFANQISIPDGGTHLAGFYAGLTRALNQHAKSSGIAKSKTALLTGKQTRTGLVALVAITLPYPKFEGSFKNKLRSKIRGMVESFVYQNLISYFQNNPAIAQAITTALRIAHLRRATARLKTKDLGEF